MRDGGRLIYLEDALKAVSFEYLEGTISEHDLALLLTARKKLKSIPAVDAVDVVRCEACLYRSQYSDENGMYHCGGIETTKDHVLPVVSPDFFCAHGERRFAMKTVDADALRDALYEADAITMRGVAILNNFPTVDAVEVVHGRWIEHGSCDYECSECGFRFTSADPIEMFKYCRCGAKMDRERSDHG